jgi:hypothetical protein
VPSKRGCYHDNRSRFVDGIRRRSLRARARDEAASMKCSGLARYAFSIGSAVAFSGCGTLPVGGAGWNVTLRRTLRVPDAP